MCSHLVCLTNNNKKPTHVPRRWWNNQSTSPKSMRWLIYGCRLCGDLWSLFSLGDWFLSSFSISVVFPVYSLCCLVYCSIYSLLYLRALMFFFRLISRGFIWWYILWIWNSYLFSLDCNMQMRSWELLLIRSFRPSKYMRCVLHLVCLTNKNNKRLSPKWNHGIAKRKRISIGKPINIGLFLVSCLLASSEIPSRSGFFLRWLFLFSLGVCLSFLLFS